MEGTNYYFIITDKQSGLFNIKGPMDQDSDLIDAVCDLQREGRDIECIIVHTDQEIKVLRNEYAQNSGYQFTADSILTPRFFNLELSL